MLTSPIQAWRKLRVQSQLILMLVIATILAQAINVHIQLKIRDNMLDQQLIDLGLERISIATDFMARLPAERRQIYLSSLNLGRERYVLSDHPFVDQKYSQPEQALALRNELLDLPTTLGEVRLFMGKVAALDMCRGKPQPIPNMLVPPIGQYTQSSHPCYSEVIASLELPDVGWLNLSLNLYGAAPVYQWHFWLTNFMTLVVSIAFIIYASRSLLRPVRKLQKAVQKSGHSLAPTLVEEQGAADIRELINEYNQMQLRISRFVNNRTQLLAAISHDLRTPITSMLLRLDFLPDCEDKTKLIENLEALKATADESLNFVRETNSDEEFEVLDLLALVEVCCEDLADTGKPVELMDTQPEISQAAIRGQHYALKRVLDNLIQNAVNYGQQAKVTLKERGQSYLVEILDQGPGIPADEQERVFEPFVRLESSRNSETGGSGLGLAIVRSITDAHGGKVLFNQSLKGFVVTLELPRVSN